MENTENSKNKEETIFNTDFIEEIQTRESKISKVLSDLTIKKIVIVVLLLMVIIPLFDATNYV